jgi:hypothetical protein
MPRVKADPMGTLTDAAVLKHVEFVIRTAAPATPAAPPDTIKINKYNDLCDDVQLPAGSEAKPRAARLPDSALL